MGLKELPDDGTPLRQRHIMFGHAYKGQPDGQRLLARFKAGGGTLYDLEYLTNEAGRRSQLLVIGPDMPVRPWRSNAGQQRKQAISVALCRPLPAHLILMANVAADLGHAQPKVIIIGAKGRVGNGCCRFLCSTGAPVTEWDVADRPWRPLSRNFGS